MEMNIKKTTDLMQDDLLKFCGEMIKTPSPSGHEQDIALLLARKMEELGYDEVFTDDWGNVIGIVKGSLPGPTIMYNGHMDAVETGEVDTWEGYDPFGAEIDKVEMENPFTGEMDMTQVIHGRGGADLKCNLASQIFAGGALAKMKEEGVDFSGTFLLAAVVLEENGEMMGTIKLVEGALKDKGIEIDAMVCCEPSSLKLMLGHRGRMEIRVEITGRSCHGSSPWLGINAVEKSAPLIQKVREMMDAKNIEDKYLGKPGITLTMYDCSPNELCIVPNKCVMVFDRRLIPGETVKGAIKEIQDICDDIAVNDPDFHAKVSVNSNLRTAFTGKSEVIESSKEVWIIDREHPFIKACAEGVKEMGEPVVYGYWSFSTDTPLIGTRMKKPVIGYGAGQEYLIHTPQEKVRLDFIARSLPVNVAMFLHAIKLPKEVFKV